MRQQMRLDLTDRIYGHVDHNQQAGAADISQQSVRAALHWA